MEDVQVIEGDVSQQAQRPALVAVLRSLELRQCEDLEAAQEGSSSSAETGIAGSGSSWNPPRPFIQSAKIGVGTGKTALLPMS
jgi:hypothetical protein